MGEPPYDLGLADGREGRFERMGRVDVSGRREYEHGWLIGQAERIAAGLPAARTAAEDEDLAGESAGEMQPSEGDVMGENDRIFVSTSSMAGSVAVAWAAASSGIFSRGDRPDYDGELLIHQDGRATLKWWAGDTPYVLVVDPAAGVAPGSENGYVAIFETEDQPPDPDAPIVWRAPDGDERTEAFRRLDGELAGLLETWREELGFDEIAAAVELRGLIAARFAAEARQTQEAS